MVQAFFIACALTLFTACSKDEAVEPTPSENLAGAVSKATNNMNNATNLTEAERISFKAQLAKAVSIAEVNAVLAAADSVLPVRLNGLVFETVEKNPIVDFKETGWKKIEELDKVFNLSQKTVLNFDTYDNLSGMFWIDASYVAQYRHLYAITDGSKFTFSRDKRTLLVNVLGLKFSYAIVSYKHQEQLIQLRITKYNNAGGSEHPGGNGNGGGDHLPGYPYGSGPGTELRYMVENYILKMKVLKKT